MRVLCICILVLCLVGNAFALKKEKLPFCAPYVGISTEQSKLGIPDANTTVEKYEFLSAYSMVYNYTIDPIISSIIVENTLIYAIPQYRFSSLDIDKQIAPASISDLNADSQVSVVSANSDIDQNSQVSAASSSGLDSNSQMSSAASSTLDANDLSSQVSIMPTNSMLDQNYQVGIMSTNSNIDQNNQMSVATSAGLDQNSQVSVASTNSTLDQNNQVAIIAIPKLDQNNQIPGYMFYYSVINSQVPRYINDNPDSVMSIKQISSDPLDTTTPLYASYNIWNISSGGLTALSKINNDSSDRLMVPFYLWQISFNAISNAIPNSVDNIQRENLAYRVRHDPFETMMPMYSWHIQPPPPPAEIGPYYQFHYRSDAWKRRVWLEQHEHNFTEEEYQRLVGEWLETVQMLYHRKALTTAKELRDGQINQDKETK